MGPRLVSRGNEESVNGSPTLVLLQWGRGSSAAETTYRAEFASTDDVLQWGRGSSAAETGQKLIEVNTRL